MSEPELKRLKEAFKRSSSLSGYMSRNAFFREVLGDNVPLRLAEVTYSIVSVIDVVHCCQLINNASDNDHDSDDSSDNIGSIITCYISH